MKGTDRYQIRHAAGKYWLLDMEQAEHYKKPIVMNETGALILESYWKTESIEQTAEAIGQIYEIDLDEAKADVKIFLEQLAHQGIIL